MKKIVYIMAAAATVLAVGVAVHSCVVRVEPDITLSYIGENYFDSDEFYDAVSELENIIEDANGDGQKNVELAVISFSGNLTASQEQNALTRLTMSMGAGRSRVYLMDRAYCMRYADDEILADLSEYTAGSEDVLANDEGKVYGIGVNGNPLLERLGLDETEGVYVALRAVTEMDYVNYDNIDLADEQARILIEYIINNNITQNNENEV